MITSNQEFEAFFNYATIGIVVTNKAGIITNFNKYAETQFGYSKDEILGKSVEVLVPLAFHSAHQHHRHTFNKHPEPRRMGEGAIFLHKKKMAQSFQLK
jgi:PAS domain S-box-containing protein